MRPAWASISSVEAFNTSAWVILPSKVAIISDKNWKKNKNHGWWMITTRNSSWGYNNTTECTVATMVFQINNPFSAAAILGLPYRETGPNGRPGFAWKWCTFKIHWMIHGFSWFHWPFGKKIPIFKRTHIKCVCLTRQFDGRSCSRCTDFQDDFAHEFQASPSFWSLESPHWQTSRDLLQGIPPQVT